MGIKNLSKFIKQFAQSSIVKGEKYRYFKKKVAVDTSHYLYQIVTALDNPVMVNNVRGDLLRGFFYKIINLYEIGFLPIFVFDGPPPKIKQKVLSQRRKKKDDALSKSSETTDENDLKKLTKISFEPTSEEIDECRLLLYLLGIPFVNSCGEADPQCASLTKNNCVWGAISNDMDFLAFQTKVLLKDVKIKEGKIKCVEYNLDKILAKLEWDVNQFIDLCILLGCDYSSTIKGIGYRRAYEYITKYKTIENILDNVKKEVPDDFNYKEARECFKNSKTIPIVQIKWRTPLYYEVGELLCDKHYLNEKQTNKALERLEKAVSKLNI